MTTLDDAFEGLLREHLPYLESAAPLEPDANLAELGLDSMAAIELLMAIEERFGVEFPDELLVPETFESPVSLWNATELVAAASTA